MIRPLVLAALGLQALAADPADLLRLSNGELEGRFAGLERNGILTWHRDDGVGPIEFKLDRVQQIVLGTRDAVRPDAATSHLTLANGDRLPGDVVRLTDDHLNVETPMAGTLLIPREALASISPNPFGGKLLYAGPFSPDGWRVLNPNPDNGREPEGAWRHRGSSWYFTGGQAALALDTRLPDEAVIRFKLAWRNRPPLTIAFHADFQTPEIPPDAGKPSRNGNLAWTYGNAYVLNLRASYAQLQHCGFTADGEPFVDPIRSSSSNVRFDEAGEATFEIRSNRSTGHISLFVNDEFAVQWDVAAVGDEADQRGPVTGGGIGFFVPDGDTPVRVSDVVIAEWNGMPDAARSLESDEFDIVLLTNGTDRFSGKVLGIQDGQLQLEGAYARLDIPYEAVAEIHFARSGRRQADASSAREVRVHFAPIGRFSGEPLVADGKTLSLASPLLGPVELSLAPALILEFDSANSFLNYWDEDL